MSDHIRHTMTVAREFLVQSDPSARQHVEQYIRAKVGEALYDQLQKGPSGFSGIDTRQEERPNGIIEISTDIRIIPISGEGSEVRVPLYWAHDVEPKTWSFTLPEPEAPAEPTRQPGKVSFFVPGLPPGPNTTRNQKWQQRAGEDNAWRDTAYLALHVGTGGRWPKMERVIVTYTLVAATAHRRDPDNISAACKPILDAVVRAGVIKDDAFAILGGSIDELRCRAERGDQTGVRVDIVEVI